MPAPLTCMPMVMPAVVDRPEIVLLFSVTLPVKVVEKVETPSSNSEKLPLGDETPFKFNVWTILFAALTETGAPSADMAGSSFSASCMACAVGGVPRPA